MQDILSKLKKAFLYQELNYNDILQDLKLLREQDLQAYILFLKNIKKIDLANIAMLMPDFLLEDLLDEFSSIDLAKAAEKLESDDATDLIQAFELINPSKAASVLANINKADKEEIIKLKAYAEDEAGAWMQTELFTAINTDTIKTVVYKYRRFKERTRLNNVLNIFITDIHGKFINSVELGELLLHDFTSLIGNLCENKESFFIKDSENISKATELVEDYDLSVLAVVNKNNKLLGRITYDDIHDIIEERATEQIYNLAGVDDEAEDENTFTAAKARALWLMLNLVTSLISAHIISFFSGEIEKLVALAALMPIVASMGGNTGSQALAVTVRRLSLNEISFKEAKKVISRELQISIVNGFFFAFIIGFIAWFWFSMPMLGVVIAISMLANLSIAGFIGSFVPLCLKGLGVDPAVGSSVLLTATTDALGFFSFLFLAKLILIP